MEISGTYWHSLATDYADRLEGKGLLDARSGLLLWAPKGSGKTSFILNGLFPETIQRQWLPIYVDLEGSKKIDPQVFAAECIKNAFHEEWRQMSHSPDSLYQNGLSAEASAIMRREHLGFPDFATFMRAFEILNKATEKPIVFILDEAQLALTTRSGDNMLYALKAARDTLNHCSGMPTLMLVFTGSDRDQLRYMTKHTQPFFGSFITDFPIAGHWIQTIGATS